MRAKTAFDRAADIFEKVMELPEEERPQTARRMAGADQEVLGLLGSMLHGSGLGDCALDRPLVEYAEETWSEDALPEQVGDYRILGILGQGGMGTVFDAEQQSPQRRVALKLLRGGMLDHTMLKRFEHEAQVLGWLNHPGIAQVFEAGQALVGAVSQPFIAMELVEGKPIDQYARENKLDHRARLILLANLCDAVQHAHQKGVVHRDLKPGNVLVTEDGQVKVLDFGIARITDADLMGSVGQTQTGQLIGTLAYMSPEQVAGDPSQVDTRADVYALGVVGFELLSEQRPILVAGYSLPEAVRMIAEQEPTPLGQLVPRLRGDVEVIVGHALDKDRDRRYTSAGALADDLRRHLNDQPILARAPTKRYLVKKFTRRHRLLVSASALLMAFSLGFGIVMAVQAKRLSDERDVAQRKTALSREVAEFLVQLFEVSAPEGIRSNQLTARDLLDVGSKRIRSEIKGDDALRSELLVVMGRTYTALGLYDEADPLLTEAAEISQGLGSLERLNAEYHEALLLNYRGNFSGARDRLLALLDECAKVENLDGNLEFRIKSSLIGTYSNSGQPSKALDLAEALLEEAARLWGTESARYATTAMKRGALLEEMGRYEESILVLKDAGRSIRERFGVDHPEHIESLRLLADSYMKAGELDETVKLLEQALDLDRQVYGENHPNVDLDLYQLASALSQKGELDRAIEAFLEVLERDKKNLGDHPYVGMDMTEIANLYSRKGDYREADKYFEQGLAIQQRLYPPGHLELATTLSNWAGHHIREAKPKRALELQREVLAVRLQHLPESHPHVLTSRNSIAVVLMQLHEYEEAEPMLRAILKARREILGKNKDVEVTLYALAFCLNAQERYLEGLECMEEAIELFERFYPTDGLDVGRALGMKGRLLNSLGRYTEAEEPLRRCLQTCRKHLVPGHRKTGLFHWHLAKCIRGQGRLDEAESMHLKSLEILEGGEPLATKVLIEIWKDYVVACREAGRPAKREKPEALME